MEKEKTKKQFSFEKSVGAVIFRRDKNLVKYLVLDYGKNYWSYPKGHVEKGENEIETLKREVKEETGITDLKIIPGFKAKNKYFYRAGKEEKERRTKEGLAVNIFKSVIYYLAETKSKSVKLSFEHRGYEWLPFEKALKRISYKNSKEVLKEANEFLVSNKRQTFEI